MNYYHYLIFLLVALVGIAMPVKKAEAGHLVVLMVGDTKAENIGEGVEKDLRNMQAEVQEISHYTGLEVEEVVISNEQVKRGEILNEISNLEVHSNDVLMFFYSGHGSHEGKDPSNPWPYLLLSRDRTTIDLDKINDLMMAKHPRFYLSVANACNGLAPPGDSPGILELKSEVDYSWLISHNSRTEANYKKLFLDSQGAILVTSSKVGEPSYGRPAYGGYYPYAFVTGLQEVAKNSKFPSWEKVLRIASKQVQVKQTPDYKLISLKD